MIKYISLNNITKKRGYKNVLIILLCFVILQFLIYSYAKYNNNNNSYKWLTYENLEMLQYPSEGNLTWIVDEWQYLGDPKLRFQLYSAYFDSRVELYKYYYKYINETPIGAIRIIGVFPLYMGGEPMNCHYKYSNYTMIVPAINVEAINENYGWQFSAFFINCHLSTSDNTKPVEMPEAVALSYNVENSMQQPEIFIKIRYPINEKIRKKASDNINLAICVPPFHRNYSEALRIVEFIEIYKILGVEKFYFYIKSISSDVNDVLEYYKRSNISENLKWNFNGYAFEKDIRYEGIFAALNDCLYRATFVDGYQYLAVVDLDEILIPMQHLSLIDFLKEYSNPNIYMYLFRSVLLYSYLENDNIEVDLNIVNRFLYTQMKTQRTSPLKQNLRTKYIANGANCVELGNHFVWVYLKHKEKFVVSPLNGLLYHYRNEVLTDVENKEKISDKTVQIYGDLLWPAVDKACQEIFTNKICPIN